MAIDRKRKKFYEIWKSYNKLWKISEKVRCLAKYGKEQVKYNNLQENTELERNMSI